TRRPSALPTTCESGSCRRSTGCDPASSWARTWCCYWALRASRQDLAARLVEVAVFHPGRAERVERVRVVERVVRWTPLLQGEVERPEVVPGVRILGFAFGLEEVVALRA